MERCLNRKYLKRQSKHNLSEFIMAKDNPAKTKNTNTASVIGKISTKQFKESILKHLNNTYAVEIKYASDKQVFNATSAALNEYVHQRLAKTQTAYIENDTRAVHYFSLEFLMGRLTSNNLYNLGLFETAQKALNDLGADINVLIDQEEDMALGNGGLGRLAACFIDSLATMELPAVGYGIHYEHGLFRQSFKDGRQMEVPDTWREYGNPFELCREEQQQQIPLYGHVETSEDENGNLVKNWQPAKTIKGIPWDVPIVGYSGNNVNLLRLWESRSVDFFDWDVFDEGHYHQSFKDTVEAETISKVLYPNDETDAGKELRLIQQYFFSACSLKDIIARYKTKYVNDWSKFSSLVAVQLNDTHPAIAIPELMRILVDAEQLSWDSAWQISRETFSYTNHTLLPEALEKWSVSLIERVLPRHLEIICEINRRFLDEEVQAKWPNNDNIKAKLSIIEEAEHGSQRMVRMGNLSVIGSNKVNGVAEVHSSLVKTDLFPEFNALWPEKLTNVTNGVTPRRWLKACNPSLAQLIDKTVGTEWPTNLELLRGLDKKANDTKFQKAYMEIKHQNKVELTQIIKQETGIDVDPNAIFKSSDYTNTNVNS